MVFAWSQIVEIIPPFVAASEDDRLDQSSLEGSLQPANTVPNATEPGVDVATAGSHATVHDNGLNESYVAANCAVRVPVHLVGVMGIMMLQPVDLDVTGNISMEVRDAEVSLTVKCAWALARIENATGIARLL